MKEIEIDYNSDFCIIMYIRVLFVIVKVVIELFWVSINR